MAECVEARGGGPCARSGQGVDWNSGALEEAKHSEVGEAAEAPGAERDPDLEPGDVARDPADRAAALGARRQRSAADRLDVGAVELRHVDDTCAVRSRPAAFGAPG